jgi:hypothetical protein
MRNLIAGTLMLFVATGAAAAQDAIPSLKGTWSGTGKILLFGTTEHLSGSPLSAVVRDLTVTHTVLGQDGRLVWGTTSSASNDSKEPFAWALAADNKTIVGADTDGYYGSRCWDPTGWRSVTSRTPCRRDRQSSRPVS